MTKENRPTVLIEKWLPVQELGIECQRERGASSALPPISFLHVWWARRPLILSRASLLASVLPEDTDREWFLSSIGINGDPKAAKERIEEATKTGERLKDPFGYERAFKYIYSGEKQKEINEKIHSLWGASSINILDPMAGGGSIPFESNKLGFDTYANEFNPVAHVIERATIEYPALYGKELYADIEKWADRVQEIAGSQLEEFFPKEDQENIFAYIWARTVSCSDCQLKVPLSPNWWLEKTEKKKIAVKLIVNKDSNECIFELIENVNKNDYNPEEGTVARGIGKCPRCGTTIQSEYIKEEAQNGRMGQQLYALGTKVGKGKRVKRIYRLPKPEDLGAINHASNTLQEKYSGWAMRDLVPLEDFPEVSTDPRPIYYGMPKWKDFFSPRQLLAHLTYLEAIGEVKREILETYEQSKATAIITYLAVMLDKAVDYNSRMARWHSSRGIMTNTFDRHDFSFKWSHAEFDHSRMLWPWVKDQVLDAYKGISELVNGNAGELFENKIHNKLTLTQGSAANLHHIGDGTLHAIVVDPPYYDNVMYAELSDFFYVWMKRTLGDIYPEVFYDELTNKDDEAVANPARFKGFDVSQAELAKQDYQQKMQDCFTEMYRVLRSDGVLTVMFTHKKVDAWDTLASALINAGFEITASWPVHTESEHSLHQARKNAAASTILLVCRKRDINSPGGWWEDILPEVRRTALQKVQEFISVDITGVDLYLATFGPVLGVLSRHWPVQDRSGEPITPDKALDEARRVVTDYRVQVLLQGRRGQFDPVTRWYILAWDIYKAPQFPFDEGHKLALSVGVDVDSLRAQKQIYKKDGNFIVLASPKERSRRGKIDINTQSFTCYIDAIHTALLIYEEDGAAAVRRFVQQANLLRSEDFLSAYAALVRAIPAGQPEHRQLKDMAIAAMDEKLDPLSLW
ncbi:MAG: DUF1156 domain-containing protein [Bacillota bacterium]